MCLLPRATLHSDSEQVAQNHLKRPQPQVVPSLHPKFAFLEILVSFSNKIVLLHSLATFKTCGNNSHHLRKMRSGKHLELID
jgi:hypothetical protein